MSHKHPHDRGPPSAKFGEEPLPKEAKVGCRYGTISHFLGQHGHGFDDAQPGNEELGTGVCPEAVDLWCPKLRMGVLDQAAGVQIVIGHYRSSRSARRSSTREPGIFERAWRTASNDTE